MGHEAIVYGVIIGASYRAGTEQYRLLQERNAEVIRRLPEPEADEWPWLNRSVFALPGGWPQGTYRRQAIHFGLTIKDDPQDRGCWDDWLVKFEEVLRQMYWISARIHLETEFESRREYVYVATTEALDALSTDEPEPVSSWIRVVQNDGGADEGGIRQT